MTTLNHFLERMRRDLGDTDPVNTRWADTDLEQHLRHALELLSAAAPTQHRTTLTAPGGTRDLDVSAITGRLSIDAVEYPAGQYPACYAAFSLWGDTLTLLVDGPPAAGDAVTVYWAGSHAVDPAGCSVPVQTEHLLVLGATGYAALQQASAAIDHLNTGGPAAPHDYLLWGRERLAHFQQGLAELRRRRGLQARSLYVPAAPPPSQSTVGEV